MFDWVRRLDTTADYAPLSPCAGTAPVSLNIPHLTDAGRAQQLDCTTPFMQKFEIRLARRPTCHVSHYQDAASVDTLTQVCWHKHYLKLDAIKLGLMNSLGRVHPVVHKFTIIFIYICRLNKTSFNDIIGLQTGFGPIRTSSGRIHC